MSIRDSRAAREILGDGACAGEWSHPSDDGQRLVCDLCPRACVLKPGDRGFCFVRENRAGQMVLSTYGRSTGFCIDPIEKKPLNHFYPGTSVLSFGTAGCNLGCKFCQNWDISKSREIERLSEAATPETIARAAQKLGCQSVAFTYNDPVIWAEYAIDTARACRELGVKTVAVTAGYITPAARPAFFAEIDAANVDLKGFSEDFYQQLTLSHLAPVLDTLRWLKHESHVWFEVTNLIIPRANDDPDELRRMCDWLLDNLGPDVPVHFTAFHPDYRLQDRPPTPPETLVAAWDLARQAGLRYAYVGNHRDPRRQSTWCPNCQGLLVARDGYSLSAYHLRQGHCGHCGTLIAGRWGERLGTWGPRRQPVRIADFAPPSPPGTSAVAEPRGSSKSLQSNVASPSVSAARTSPPAPPRNLPIVDPAPPSPAADPSPIERAAWLEVAAHWLQAAVARASGLPLPPSPTVELPRGRCDGAFVSLKRQGKLRACCGFLGAALPPADAISRAACRTAVDDVRFPPLAAAELPYLDLEVWLLEPPRRVEARGAERARAVEIGRHGLQIVRRDQRGLLLPGVATDHGLSAEEFLEHVCLKAGLPPTAWREDDTELWTFEGRVARGSLAEWLPGSARGADESPFGPRELAALVDYCRTNVQAQLTGATPNYYLLGAPEANVNGAWLGLTLPEAQERIDSLRLSLRPTVALQSTLFGLAEAGGRALAARGLSAGHLAEVGCEVAIFTDPTLHGTVAEPDLRGWRTSERACLVFERGRTALVFDPALSAAEVVARAASLLELTDPGPVGVTSLRVATTAPRIELAQVPRPQTGQHVRPPAVAGRFYPGDPVALAREVEGLFGGLAKSSTPRENWAAAMVPHAGWVYSGRIAAGTLARLAIPRTVVVLGPKHTPLGVDYAVSPCERWALPGGSLPSDPELAASLVRAVPGWQLDVAAHQQEHAIEVELPLLAHLAPSTRVIGVALGPASWTECRQFAEGLAAWLAAQSEAPLLLISSDMNHFASDAENRRLDEQALRALETLEPEQALRNIREHHISMCGVVPAVVALEALRLTNRLHQSQRVAYATSADVSGDTSRVVGYAGMLFG